MRIKALSLATAGLAGSVALAGCDGVFGPSYSESYPPAVSSDAYTKGPPEGSTAIQADPKAPVVLLSATDVRTVQGRLRQLNFAPRATSGGDAEAQAAVEEFQRAYGLPVGPRDRATLEAMGLSVVPLTRTGPVASTKGLAGLTADAEAPPGETRVGALIDNGRGPTPRPAASAVPGGRALAPRSMSRADVTEVQRKLLDRGHYRGEVDGIWGPLSDRALTEFQTTNGLPATGQIDAQTASRLELDLQRMGSGGGQVYRIGPGGTTTGTVGGSPPGTVPPGPVPGYQRQ